MQLTALHHHAFTAMDCEIGLWLAGTRRETATLALAEAEAFIREAEATLSRFQPNSELSHLNRVGSAPVNNLLWQVLTAALAAAQDTNGLFDPAVLPMLKSAGYDRPFRDLAAVAGECTVMDPFAARWDSISLDPRTRTVTLPAGMQIDLGGIAKGWLADAVVQRLSAHGPCLADLGGDIAAVGAPHGRPGWSVGIADPLHPDADLVILALQDTAVATSGRDYRVWDGPDGARRHHIIDPRTGRPAVTDALSVSVVAQSCARAESLAKAALILGARAGVRYLEQQGVEGMVVLEDGTVGLTPRFTRLQWSSAAPVAAV